MVKRTTYTIYTSPIFANVSLRAAAGVRHQSNHMILPPPLTRNCGSSHTGQSVENATYLDSYAFVTILPNISAILSAASCSFPPISGRNITGMYIHDAVVLTRHPAYPGPHPQLYARHHGGCSLKHYPVCARSTTCNFIAPNWESVYHRASGSNRVRLILRLYHFTGSLSIAGWKRDRSSKILAITSVASMPIATF